MKVKSATLEAAMSYLQWGWSVIPLCTWNHQGMSKEHVAKCHRPGKTPAIAWKFHQEHPPKGKALEIYWHNNPLYNVGVVMGPVSNLIGIDIDSDKGWDFLKEEYGVDSFPTWRFKSPGGERILFQWPQGLKEVPIRSFKDENNKEMLRILSQGTQTVLPPSRSFKGWYCWKSGFQPGEIPLAPCPDWLLAMSEKKEKPVAVTFVQDEAIEIIRGRAYLQECEPCVAGQGGHNKLFKICCHLIHGLHLTQQQTLVVLEEYNAKCQPPWSEAEMRHKVQDAEQKGSADDMGPSKTEVGKSFNKKEKEVQEAKKEPVYRNLLDVETKAMQWLWKNYIPMGKTTMLDGDPGLGKSTLLLDIAARMSQDGVMPDGTQGLQGRTLILSGEDDIADTIVPRLIIAQADLGKIDCLEGVRIGEKEEDFTLNSYMELLANLVAQKSYSLLIIDPVMAFLDSCDANKETEVRSLMRKLRDLGEKTGLAIVLQRHLNKAPGKQAIYRGGGSIGWVAASRQVLVVGVNPDDDKKRVLAVAKTNRSKKADSLVFMLNPQPWMVDGVQDEVCRVEWCGVSPYDADTLVNQPQTPEAKEKKEEEISTLEEACEWLKDFLKDGPVAVSKCKSEGKKECGASSSTMQRARRKINAKVQGKKWSLY